MLCCVGHFLLLLLSTDRPAITHSPSPSQLLLGALRQQDGLDHVAFYNAAFIQSPDLTEGVMAQLQKRKPEYASDAAGPTLRARL